MRKLSIFILLSVAVAMMISPAYTDNEVISESEVHMFLDSALQINVNTTREEIANMYWDDVVIRIVIPNGEVVLSKDDSVDMIMEIMQNVGMYLPSHTINELKIDGQTALVDGVLTEKLTLKNGRQVVSSSRQVGMLEKRNGELRYIEMTAYAEQ